MEINISACKGGLASGHEAYEAPVGGVGSVLPLVVVVAAGAAGVVGVGVGVGGGGTSVDMIFVLVCWRQ